jgi:hypothetical protein
MSARKNVNQSRPRALACGDALAVAGAVCFNVASDGRPTSARRSSRPPSNSSASVDSPLPPAPSGNYGVGVWPNAPRTRPPSPLGYPHHPLAGRSIGVCSPVLKYAKEAILRSPVSSAKTAGAMTKFQSSETFAREKGTRRWLNYSSDSSALFLVSQRWARRANECASRRPLGRAFEASLADAQLEPAESVGMRAVHFRSRIPAMALT